MISLIKKQVFKKFRADTTRQHELNYLFWECTTRCNLSCLHCGSDCSKDSRHPDMPASDFFNALDTIKNPAPGFLVVITGGEPLLRQDIEACGREIRSRGMRWSMVSNGMLYTPERHNALLNAGMGALTISLDGLEDTHNWLRNTTKSYQKALIAIRLAASAKRLSFDVVTCVNQRNILQLPQIYDLLLNNGVRAWRLFTIIPKGRAAGNKELILTNGNFTSLMQFIRSARKDRIIDVKFSCEGYVGNYEYQVRDTPFFCRAGINIGSVLIDGSIAACPNIDHTFVQGNIYNNNLFETWQNRYQQFRNREWMKTGRCSNCNEFIHCQGNGFHNRIASKEDVLVCHFEKLYKAAY